MHLGFVNASDRPLACVVEATFDALPAGKLKRRKFLAKRFLGPTDGFAVSAKADGPGARATHSGCFVLLRNPVAVTAGFPRPITVT